MSRFTEIVSTYGPRAMRDLGISAIGAAGLFGNGDVESGGYVKLQEIKPVVAGSRGGYGWMQWTGPRRRQYEAACAAQGLNPAGDEANYGFMVAELKTTEKAALAALKRAKTVEAAARAVCNKYLRPGIPHLERRIASAQRAYAILAPGAAPGPVRKPAAPAAAPRVETITPEAKPLPWWARLLGRKANPVDRPGLHPSGNPELYDAQKALRARAYYTKGNLDGLDGPLTEEAVAQARKDNGMGDGGVDAAFLAALPGFPQRPVSAARLNMPITQAAKHLPEVFGPAKWLATIGAGAIGAGTADGTGLLDNVQSAAGRVNDVASSVQGAFAVVGGAIGFVVEHRTLFLILGGVAVLIYALNIALSAWIKVRQAFF